MSAPSSSPSQLPASTWRATAIVLGIASLLLMALALYYRSPATSAATAHHTEAFAGAPPTLVLVVQKTCEAHANTPAGTPQRARQRRVLRAST